MFFGKSPHTHKIFRKASALFALGVLLMQQSAFPFDLLPTASAAYVTPGWTYASYGNFNTTLANLATPTLTANCNNDELTVRVSAVSGSSRYAYGFSTQQITDRAVNNIRKNYFVTWYGNTGSSFILPNEQPSTTELRFNRNTAHYIYVFAYNDGTNTSSPTATEIRMPDPLKSMCTAPTPGGVPNNLNISPSGANSLQLQWTRPSTSNTTDFQIELLENDVVKSTFTVNSGSSSTSYNNAIAGASYRFRMRSVNNLGYSTSYGNWSSFSNTVTAAEASPILSNFTVGGSSSQAGWTNSTAFNYGFSASNFNSSTIVEIDHGAGFSPVTPGAITGSSTLSGSGPSFNLSLRAKNGSSGTYSNVLTQTIKLDNGAPTVQPISISSTPLIVAGDTPINNIGCTDPVLSDGSTGSGCATRQYIFKTPKSVASCSALSGDSWSTAVSYPVNITESADVCFRAYDNAGNIGYSTPTTVYIDRTAPTLHDVTLSQNASQLNFQTGTWYSTQTGDIIVDFTIQDDLLEHLGNEALNVCQAIVGSNPLPTTTIDCTTVPGNTATRRVTIPSANISEGTNGITLRIQDKQGKENMRPLILVRDLQAPGITILGLVAESSNYFTTAKSDLGIQCNDDISGCPTLGLRYLLSDSISGTCDAVPPTAAWVTCADSSSCALPTVSSVQQLCVTANDRAGHIAHSLVYTISVDTRAPTITDLEVLKNGTPVNARDNTFYLNTTSAGIQFIPDDVGTGIDHCSINGTNVACVAGAPLSHTLSSLPVGEQTVRVSIFDRAGNPVHADLNLFVDTTPPTISGPFIAAASETNRQITLTLPTSFEDTNGSGVDYLLLHIEQNGSDFTGLTREMIAGTNPFITVDNTLGHIIIARDTTADNPAFPESIILNNLPAVFAGTQVNYSFALEAFDRAGNATTATNTVNVAGIAFDTLAPTINEIRSTSNGTGTAATPFLVNNTRNLQLVVGATETNNSAPFRSSLPLRLVTQNGGAIAVSGTNTLCTSLLADNTCIGTVNLTIPESFSGSIEVAVADAGNNQSAFRTLHIKQDSDAPTWLPGGTIEAISPNGAATLAPRTPFLSESFYFRATGLVNNDAERQLYANVRYTNNTGAEVSQRVAMVEQSENTYTFNLGASNLAYGTSILGFAMEDSYGNIQTGSDTRSYETFHDNRRPIVTNFNYRFEDNNAIVAWDSIVEDSFPVRVSVEASEDGETWTPRGDVNIGPFASAAAAQNYSTTVSDVLPGTQLRLEFRDQVMGYRADGSGFEVVGTPSTHYLMRDMLLTVAVDRENEQLAIGYIPQNDVTDLRSYSVSYTGPNGANSFTTITDFASAGGSIGIIEAPLIGQYTFTAVLTKNDGSTQTTRRNFTLAEDILTPRATITLAPSASLRFEESDGANGTWYFNSDSPELAFQYAFTAQNGEIYDESMPVTIEANGTTFSEPLVLNTINAANRIGTYRVELIDDNVYNITVSATDNAAAQNQVSYSFRVVKDRSNPEVRVTARADGEAITLVGSATGEENTLQTRAATVDLEVAVDGEVEPVTMEVRLGGTLLETRTALSGMSTAPFTQGYTYSIPLEDASVSTLQVMVRDRSGRTTTEDVRIRRDTQGPVVTGNVVFASASSNVNPVPLAEGLTVTDYTPVSYTVVANGVRSERRLFTGNAILLEEGVYTNLRIIFSDALGNESIEYNPLSGDVTEIYVDTQIPTFTMTATPTGARTNSANATIQVQNISDAGTEVTLLISQNGRNVLSQAMPRAQFASGSGFTLPFDANLENSFEVRIRDGANNVSEAQRYNIIHDNQGPEVTNIVGAANAGHTAISWTFSVNDRMGTDLTLVRVLLHDQTTGRVTATPLNIADAPNFTFDAAIMSSGRDYRMIVIAEDALGNGSIVPSPTISIPQDPLDALDPLENGPEIEPGITGNTITVTITNLHLGGNINYVAEDMTRGTHVILGEVLSQGVNTVTGQPLAQLPVGTYRMTIVDEAGNIQVIDPFIIHPYYTDAGGDLDGNGFGGGISDHKILLIAVARGNVYVGSPALVERLAQIRALIATNIRTQIEAFLRN